MNYRHHCHYYHCYYFHVQYHHYTHKIDDWIIIIMVLIDIMIIVDTTTFIKIEILLYIFFTMLISLIRLPKKFKLTFYVVLTFLYQCCWWCSFASLSSCSFVLLLLHFNDIYKKIVSKKKYPLFSRIILNFTG